MEILKLSAEALNHLLSQNSWAAPLLQGHAGKTVRLSMPPLGVTLCIAADGSFEAVERDAVADAEIRMAPTAALRSLLDPAAARSLAELHGDNALAMAIGKVLQGLRWDAEEDLSRIVGDIPAHELSQAAGRLRSAIGRQAASVAGMLAEYWLEEQPMIAKRRHLEAFAGDVDTLRDDIERLAKRIARLEQLR